MQNHRYVLNSPSSLVRMQAAPLPTATELPPTFCLVKLHAASLNYRDVMIFKGTYPWPVKPDLVPGSDAAGEIIAVGSSVTRFKPGDRVIPTFLPTYISGPFDFSVAELALGGSVDGIFRNYGTFSEQALVPIPLSLSYAQAATLPCAAVAAWNSLYSSPSHRLVPGSTVLIQGTGGVSLFALQFAVAGGATVIATTSTSEKASLLKKLGAAYVVNYLENENWGEEVKQASYEGKGVDIVVEIGGSNTMKQSTIALKDDGLIAVVGGISEGQTPQAGGRESAFAAKGTVRRVVVGSRLQLEECIRAIVANGIVPVIDRKSWRFEELQPALNYLAVGKHVGKVIVDFY